MDDDFSKFLNGGFKGIALIRNNFPNEYIQQMANEEGVSFEVMVKTIENKLKL